MKNQKKIRFNISDVISSIEASIEESNRLVKIINNSKLDDSNTEIIINRIENIEKILTVYSDKLINIVSKLNENYDKFNLSTLIFVKLKFYIIRTSLLITSFNKGIISNIVNLKLMSIALKELYNSYNYVFKVLEIINKFSIIKYLFIKLRLKRIIKLMYGSDSVSKNEVQTSPDSIKNNINLFSPFLQFNISDVAIITLKTLAFNIILKLILSSYIILQKTIKIIAKIIILNDVILSEQKLKSVNLLINEFLSIMVDMNDKFNELNITDILKNLIIIKLINIMGKEFLSTILIFSIISILSVIIIPNIVFSAKIIDLIMNHIVLLINSINNLNQKDLLRAAFNMVLLSIFVYGLQSLINNLIKVSSIKILLAMIILKVSISSFYRLLKLLMKVIVKISRYKSETLKKAMINCLLLNIFVLGLNILITQLILLANPINIIMMPLAIIMVLLLMIILPLLNVVEKILSSMNLKNILLATISILLLTIQFGLIAILLSSVLIATTVSLLINPELLLRTLIYTVLIAVFMTIVGYIFAFVGAPVLIGISLFTLSLAVFTVAIGLLIILSGLLAILAEIDVSSYISPAVKNTIALISAINEIIYFMTWGIYEPENDKSGFSQFVDVALKGLGEIGLLIVMFGKLVIAFLSVTLIIMLAGMLKLTSMLNVKNWAKQSLINVSALFYLINEIIRSINNPIDFELEDSKDSYNRKGFINNLLNFISPELSGLFSAILSIPILIVSIISVGLLFAIGGMLKKLGELQISDNIMITVKNILGTVRNISDLVLAPNEEIPVNKEDGGSKWEKFKNVINNTAVGKVVSAVIDMIPSLGTAGILATILPSVLMLGSIVDVIKSINELVIPPDINNKVSDILNVSRMISSQVYEDGDVQTIDEDKVKSFGKYVDDSVKYFKNINNLDVSKVKSLGEMYDKMGRFMDKLNDAPINEIADALVNKISPALSDINNNLDKKPNNQITEHVTNPVTQTTQPNIQMPQQIDYTSILENIEDLLEKIKQKMNIDAQLVY